MNILKGALLVGHLKNHFQLFFLLFFLCFLSACAGFGEALSASLAMNYPDSIPPPLSQDVGIVYFYGINEFANDSFIYDGTKRVGVIGPKVYTYIVANPGNHTYTVKLNTMDSIMLNIEPGKTYFLRYSVEDGMWEPQPNLELVQNDVGHAKISTLKYVILKN